MQKEHKMHYFFAVKIPNETKELLKQYIEEWKEMFPFSRWVHPMDLHITLAFLGGADEKQLAAAVENVKQSLLKQTVLTLTIDHLGIFGNVDSPRVFWAGTERSVPLQEVRNKVFNACETAGFSLETRPFRPHITLARKWTGDDSFKEDLLQRQEPSPHLQFNAKEVVLYQTHLDRSPKYQSIHSFPLQASTK